MSVEIWLPDSAKAAVPKGPSHEEIVEGVRRQSMMGRQLLRLAPDESAAKKERRKARTRQKRARKANRK